MLVTKEFYHHYISLPPHDQVPPEIRDDPRFYPYSLLHLALDTSRLPHLHTSTCPNNPPPTSVTCPTWLMCPNICTRVVVVLPLCIHTSWCLPLLHRCLTLLYLLLTPLVLFWLRSCIHVTLHMPHIETCAMSAPVYAPTKFSPLFVEYYGMKFIVW